MSDNKSQSDPLNNYLVMLSNYLYINQQTNASTAQYLEIFDAVKSISKSFLKNSQNYHAPKDNNPDITLLHDDIKEKLLDIVETYFDEIYEMGTQALPVDETLDHNEELTNNCLQVLIEYLQYKPDDTLDQGPSIDIIHHKKIMTAVKDASQEFFQHVVTSGTKSEEIISGLNNTTKNKLVTVFADFHGVFLDYLSLKNSKPLSLDEKSDSSGHTSIESLGSSQSNFKKKFAEIQKQRLSNSSSDFSGDDTQSSKLDPFSTCLNDEEEYPDDFEPEDDDNLSPKNPRK